jgi:glutathione S-transferase
MPTPSAPYRFMAFDVSYFSAKVRPALRYKGLWYQEERADIPDILRRTGHGFIPIVITPEDETWQDSTAIYDLLEERHPDPPLFPSTPVQRMTAHLIELYCDEFALIPAMHYRWGTPKAEEMARARFSAMIGNDVLGNKAADRMAGARLLLGASDEAAPVIEAHTRDLLDTLSAHLSESAYLLGDRMSFADCALMGPVYGHLFNDHVSRPLLLETARPVVGWIERCNFPKADSQGEWLADDAIAPTLKEALRVMGSDSVPMLLDLVRTVEDWADENASASDKVSRAAGGCETTLRGEPISRVAMTYVLFSVGRVLDAYHSLGAIEREQVDRAFEGTGWEDLLALELRHRLVKKGFDLAFA